MSLPLQSRPIYDSGWRSSSFFDIVDTSYAGYMEVFVAASGAFAPTAAGVSWWTRLTGSVSPAGDLGYSGTLGAPAQPGGNAVARTQYGPGLTASGQFNVVVPFYSAFSATPGNTSFVRIQVFGR